MPDIRLQDYTARIKELIQNIRLDDAIAHCQHILHHYPKHVETYCLLGETCLEKELYREAIEFFQRTLGADPENLISRVGLGIIYDEQGSLSEAIWQMERAFELSPGHPEVRRELQRLYAQRDDGQEPRLRLTRGALGRLYSRNGLYERAIDEFQAVLKQDPDLPDIQVALAEAYWRDGRRLEAADICTQVLELLPNCLKANLIIGEIWVRGGNEEDGAEMLALARALDPENRVAQELMGRESPLPPEDVFIPELEDLSVMPGLEPAKEVERAAVEGAPRPEPIAGWEGGADLPEWLRDVDEGEPEPSLEDVSEAIAPESTQPQAGDVPEWLQEVMAEEPSSPPDEGLAVPVLEELEEEPLPVVDAVERTEAEIVLEIDEPGSPAFDWEEAPEPVAPVEEAPVETTPEWLHELVEEEGPPQAEALPMEDLAQAEPPPEEPEIPASLLALVEAGLLDEADLEAAMVELSEDELEEQRTQEIPDWLRELVGEDEAPAEAEAQPVAADVTDWPRELPAEPDRLQPEEPEPVDEIAAEAVAPAAEEVPAWLRDVAESDVPVEPVVAEEPEVVEELPAEPVAPAAEKVVEAPVEAEVPAAEEEIPAWLRDLEAPEEPAEPEPVVAEAAEEVEEAPVEAEVPAAEEEIPAWLRDLEAPEEPAEPEPVVAEAAEGVEEAPVEAVVPAAEEEIPAWLRDVEAPDAAIEPAAVETGEIPPVPETPAEPVALDQEPGYEAPAPVAEVPAEREEPVVLRDREAPEEQIYLVEDGPSLAEELLMALKTRPRDYTRRLELARLYRTEQDWVSALNQYEKLISARRLLPEVLEDLEPLAAHEGVERTRLYQLMGDIYMQQDELDKSLEMYRLARKELTRR